MRRRGRSYGSCRTWPAISRRSGRLRSWINKHRPGTIRRRRQRCRKRNGNCLLVSQESVRRAASRLPLVGPAGTVAHRRSKTKTSYEGKPKAVGGRRPPPVGRPRTNNRASALKHHKIPWRKTIEMGGRKAACRWSARRSKSNQKGAPRGGSLRSPPPGSFFNKKILLHPPQGARLESETTHGCARQSRKS